MKRYGINKHEYDDILGFRDSSDEEFWYDSEEERDRAYERFTKPVRQRSEDELLDLQIEEEWGGQTRTTFSKIEKDN